MHFFEPNPVAIYIKWTTASAPDHSRKTENMTYALRFEFFVDGAPRSGSFRIGGDRMYYFSSAEVKITALPIVFILILLPLKEIGNWQHAASECCKMNMHLTAIEKVQEFDDIEAIFSSNFLNDKYFTRA